MEEKSEQVPEAPQQAGDVGYNANGNAANEGGGIDNPQRPDRWRHRLLPLPVTGDPIADLAIAALALVAAMSAIAMVVSRRRRGKR